MTIDMTSESTERCHLWPIGISPQANPRCTECGITWAEHYAEPLCKVA